MKHLARVVFALTVIALTGCSQSGSSSPQAVFDKASAAAAKGDWKTVFVCMDPDKADHMLFGRFEVHVRNDGLTATAWGEPLDPARHVLSHEVKAITYHELKVERTADGWLAEVIVDI